MNGDFGIPGLAMTDILHILSCLGIDLSLLQLMLYMQHLQREIV